jgi:hypothetical protein
MIEDRVEPGRGVVAADQIGHAVSIRPQCSRLTEATAQSQA